MSGILGTAGGASGSGFAPPGQAKLLNPVSVDQANQANTGSNNAIAQQQALLGALQGQNGIQNQSNVFSQLQGVANGTGPNPAQSQLAQATGANTANQAALMAGQRGAGANAGLIARQAAMQGAANQQNAAGQAATMQANQSLGALGQLGGMANQQVAQQVGATGAVTGANQTQQQNLLNAIAQQNNAAVGSQSSVNTGNTQLANTTMQGQQGLLGGVMNAAGPVLGALGLAEGGEVRKMYANPTDLVSVDYNNHDPVNYNNQPSMSPQSIPVPVAPQAPAQPIHPDYKGRSSFGSFLQHGAPPAPGQADYGNYGANALARGLGGMFSQPQQQPQNPSSAQPIYSDEDVMAAQMGAPGTRMPNSSMPNEDAYAAMYRAAPQSEMPQASPDPGAQDLEQTFDNPGNRTVLAKGGKIPALVSPGEIYLKPREVKEVLRGADPMKVGEKILGKAKVEGPVNSYANDTVRKDLDSGGIIVPNKETKSKNPSEASQRFVYAIAAKHGMKVMLHDKLKGKK